MALQRLKFSPKCDTVSVVNNEPSINAVSAVNKVLSQLKKSPAKKSPAKMQTSPNPIHSSFIKYDMRILDTLGSKSAALLFCALEYRFQSKPLGFYKFMSPCDNPFYKKGDSLSEELRVDRKTIQAALKKICTVYKSKSQYLTAKETYGEIGAFQGKPYLSYFHKITRQTFYLREHRAASNVLNGSYKGDIYVTKFPLQGEELIPPTGGGKIPPVGGGKIPPRTTENPLQRIPLSLSNDNIPQTEQPKEESEILVLVEQPGVTISTIDQMLVIWKKTVCLDGEPTPKKGTVDNLAKAYAEVFSESLTKWGEFCKLVASSKYLMGETTQKFKLNLAWVAKPETIDQIINGHFTAGDRTNVIYYELDTISDPNPVILQFKHACLDKFGKGRYISWMKTMRITMNEHKEIVCVAPTSFHAKYVGDNDPLGFSYFVDQLPIAAIVFKEPNGNVVGKIASRNAN